MSSHVIIIPVHNRRAVTLGCLATLRANGDLTDYRVMVVDDGSTDGTGEAVRAEFPAIEVLRGDGQLWWTGAIALGMQRVFATGAAAVCWLNDDCRPAPGALRQLFDRAVGPPASVVAPACFDAATGAPVANAFAGRTRLCAGPSETLAADGLSGYCVVVPRAVWERLGPPDARRFPHYYGDNAYTLRAARARFPVLVLGAVRAELTVFRAPPTLQAMIAAGRRGREDWQRIFVSPKSPYRLATLAAFQRLKHGPILGTAAALGRAAGWIGRALWTRRG